jgi:F0F1-type ATP synthase beta subunit
MSAATVQRKKRAASRLDKAMGQNPITNVPDIKSFEQFLLEYAEVRRPDGSYVRYSLEGREALLAAVRVIDLVLGSHTGVMLKDSKLSICGGAQIGKTIIECNLMAFGGGVRFMNTSRVSWTASGGRIQLSGWISSGRS